MADIKNKQVNIYIDQTSAINALEALQKKADGFNKKIDEAKEKQTQLLERIESSKNAAGNLDALRKNFGDLSKEIEANTKKLAENKEEKKRAKEQLQQLSNQLVDQRDKQRQLAEEIDKASDAGKSTKRLEQQYAAVTREIDRTIERIQFQDTAFQEAAIGAEHLANEIAGAKTQQKALREEIKLGEGAQRTIKSAENEYRSLEKSIEANTKSAKKLTDAQREIQSQIDRGLRPSLVETRNLVTQLRNELSRMSEDAPGYAQKFEKFQNASAELNRLQNAMNGVEKAQKSWFAEAKVVAFGVLIGNTVQTAVEAIGSYLSGIVTGNAKLSDSLSDIEKATGLSSAAVGTLNKELGSIDTRTATNDLREIAIGLGQIGEEATKAKVAAIDQIVVALGDEFGGGARQITTELSVLRNNLQDIKTGNYATDITHIGNALNVLGAEGLATAPVVTSIANRIAGISQTFKLTSGQILGVAATFQELGIAEERGSTAIQKLFQKIGAEPEKFAKVARMSITDFKNLVNKDMLGAFEAVAVGARKAGSNNIVFSKIIKELDADGSGAGEVLSKLGKNTDLLADKVELSTKALKESGSITDEFGKKNNNLAGEIAKLGKEFNGLIQSKTLVDIFKSIVASASGFIAVIRAIPKYLSENKTAISLLVAGLVLLNLNYIKGALAISRITVVKYLDIAASKLQVFWDEAGRKAKIAYWLVVDVLTKRITIATAAQELWVYVMRQSLGPIGLIITLIGAGIAAYSLFADKTKVLSAAQERANVQMEKNKRISESWIEIQEDANKQIASTVSRMEKYAKAAEDTGKSDEERKKAIEAIIRINPEYFKGLDLEAVKTGALRDKVNEYTDALRASAQQKALFDKRVGLEQKKLDLEEQLDPGEPIIKAQKKVAKDGIQIETAGEKLANKQKQKLKTEINIIVSQLEFLDKKSDELKKKTDKIPGLNKGDDESTDNPLGDTKTTDEKAAGRKAKKENDERSKLLQELKDFQFQLSQIGKAADESEIDRITKKYQELTDRAVKYGLDVIAVTKEKNRALEFLNKEQWRIFNENAAKGSKEGLEIEYKDLIQGAVQNAEAEKEIELKKYADGLINKKQLEAEIRDIDLHAVNFQIAIADSYVGRSKNAYNDLINFRKKKNKETLNDEVKTREQLEASQKREQLAAARVKVLKTQPGTTGRLEAEQAELEVKRQQEIAELQKQSILAGEQDIVNEKARINEEYRQQQAQLVIQFYAEQVQQTLGLINSGLDVLAKFNDSKSAKEKAALDRELKANEARKNSIKRLEDQKVISAQEARRRLTNIEREEEQKKEALEKKQQARAKRIAIAQAIINGAMAITSTLAAVPGAADILSLGAFRAIQIGIAVATTAAQIATISSTKYGKGGKLTGPSHSSGGMPVINPVTGIKEAEVEGGEYIISKHTVANNREVADALLDSSMNRGGAKIKRFWENRPYKTLDYPRINERIRKTKFATGGVFGGGSAAPAADTKTPATDPAIMDAFMEQRLVNQALLETITGLRVELQSGIKADVSLKKIDEARALQSRIKADSEVR
jgi:hypothetical protein